MVSDDTHDRTIQLLEANDYFGLAKDQVDIVKQENVPALVDNDANIAVDKETFRVITKPHGHGDIHNLLFDSGVAKKWRDMGKEWMIFHQDTNALSLKVIPSVLAVSRAKNWQMNSVTCSRMPGEALGGICKLVNEKDPSKEIVINIEYNQLDGLLKEKWNPEGDVKNEKGFSNFPGNVNTLIFKIPEYYENLTKTGGVIPEFVNPKYANAEKTVFKAPTILECMMQDYPKLVSGANQVGFTMYDTWFCNNPAKTNIKEAREKITQGISSFGAAEAEFLFYDWSNKMLEAAGVTIERNTEPSDFGFSFGPKVLIDPGFALTLQDLRDRFKGQNVIKSHTSLILMDPEASFENNKCKNVGYDDQIADMSLQAGDHKLIKPIEFVPVADSDAEVYQIRGYKPCYTV